MRTFAFVLVSFLFLLSCNKGSAPDANNEQHPQQNEQQAAAKKVDKKNSADTTDSSNALPAYYQNYPKTLNGENRRFVDSNKILHVDFLNSGIPLAKSKATINKMFPGCRIDYNSQSTDFFDVFDIKCEGSQYTAVVSYESNLDNKNIIAFIYIQNKPFSMNMIENLFSDHI